MTIRQLLQPQLRLPDFFYTCSCHSSYSTPPPSLSIKSLHTPSPSVPSAFLSNLPPLRFKFKEEISDSDLWMLHDYIPLPLRRMDLKGSVLRGKYCHIPYSRVYFQPSPTFSVLFCAPPYYPVHLRAIPCTSVHLHPYSVTFSEISKVQCCPVIP
jgi:hypothetical protein